MQMTHEHAGRSGPRPVHVGLVFALPVEADAFERLVRDRREYRGARFTFRTGTIAGRSVAWAVCGVGAAAAAAATRTLIAGHRPEAVVTAGFAGGLDPLLSRGDVVLPARVVTEEDPRGIALAGVPADARRPVLVTVDGLVSTAAAKRELAARTGAQLVDMETHAVAATAADQRLPCLGVRVVSDDARESLAPEAAALAAARTGLRRLGAAVGSIGRRPAAVVDLWRLWERAVGHSRTLAAAVDEVLRGLP